MGNGEYYECVAKLCLAEVERGGAGEVELTARRAEKLAESPFAQESCLVPVPFSSLKAYKQKTAT